MRRVLAVAALLITCFALVGCPSASAARFLVIRGTPSRSSATLFRELSQNVAQRLGTRATSNESSRWSCREFNLGSPHTIGTLVELYFHKPTDQLFVSVAEDMGSSELSPKAPAVLEQIRSTLESAALPATVRETGDFGEVIQLIGSDLYSRCHD